MSQGALNYLSMSHLLGMSQGALNYLSMSHLLGLE